MTKTTSKYWFIISTYGEDGYESETPKTAEEVKTEMLEYFDEEDIEELIPTDKFTLYSSEVDVY